ncbi:MAG: adenylate kinase [Dehalococcoidia bacterium]|nr:MAG: adenylate kinase [Dehalococcoidia bacterium]
MPYLVLLGAPGSGKGTQASVLAKALGVPHVASGDLLRAHVAQQTELGRMAHQYMTRGELVPDDVTIAMVMERLDQPDARQGAVLDGFPRTVAQAEALDARLAERGAGVDRALLLVVPDDELVRRLAGRWLCRQCGASYHEVSNPPRQPGRCDRCGGPLFQRDDDTPTVVRKRLAVFREQTLPLLDYYRRQGKLVEVDGVGEIAQVREALLAAALGTPA